MKSERMVVTPEHKQQQLEIINATNPAWSDSYAWIRKVEDIHSLEETTELSDWKEYDEYDPDLTRADIEKAIQTGKITLFYWQKNKAILLAHAAGVQFPRNVPSLNSFVHSISENKDLVNTKFYHRLKQNNSSDNETPVGSFLFFFFFKRK